MKYGIYFSRSFWLVVPEVLYLIFLGASWITIVVSIGMTIASILRKKEKKCTIKWPVVLLFALALAIMTMTGKIVPNTAFGG